MLFISFVQIIFLVFSCLNVKVFHALEIHEEEPQQHK